MGSLQDAAQKLQRPKRYVRQPPQLNVKARRQKDVLKHVRPARHGAKPAPHKRLQLRIAPDAQPLNVHLPNQKKYRLQPLLLRRVCQLSVVRQPKPYQIAARQPPKKVRRHQSRHHRLPGAARRKLVHNKVWPHPLPAGVRGKLSARLQRLKHVERHLGRNKFVPNH